MYIIPLLLSFLSFFFSFFFGRFFNNIFVGIFTSTNIGICLILCIISFYEVAVCQSAATISIFDWMSTSLLEIQWIFLFDSLTVTMFIVILSISLCAHIYSIEYMLKDPHQIKFMSYLSLFTWFMLLLVSSGNLVILFLGWEGVGITSYLLINFWHTRLSANKSAIMAMFVNKFGDISLLVSFTLIYSMFYTFDYNVLFNILINHSNGLDNDILFYIGLFFIIAAVGKSAQIGLHTWLPEAMEGPTPVSSLIHAATMVTAGIFLIIRNNLFFQNLPQLTILIVALGSITAFVGSTIGIFQFDIKKIIAYSTCSQLGYMFLACGLGGFNFSIYHLVNHAFFKALLFLIAGYMIHSLNNQQDIRKFGGLLFILPFAYTAITIGSLSLLGFPFLSGFFSKEKIIELFYSSDLSLSNSYLNILFFFQFLAAISVTFTILYSMKILIYSFFYNYQNNINILINLHYSSLITIIPLFMLCFLSIISGYMLEDMMVGIGSNIWNSSIFWYKSIISLHYFEFNLLSSKLPIITILYFLILFFFLFYEFRYWLFRIKFLSNFTEIFMQYFNKKYLSINKNIIYPIINLIFKFSYINMYILFDKGIIELWGPFGISKTIYKLSNNNNKIQTGLIYHYSGLIILALIISLSILNNY